mgnify:CR=1 FL=1
MRRRWEFLEPVNAVVHANPIPPLNVKKLMRIIIAQPFRIRGREVSLLALRDLKQLARFFCPCFHAKTLH